MSNQNDANTSMLNRFLAENEKKEVLLENFQDEIDDVLCELGDIISDLQARAKDVDGMDFTEELNGFLTDLI